MSKNTYTKNKLTISQLSSETGVNSVTIRAWERRYGLLTPQRDAKGHRLYSTDDVDIIHRILAYIDRGISVGNVKALLKERVGNKLTKHIAQQAREVWQQYVEKMLAAIETFSQKKVESIYNEILSLYPIDIMTQRLLLPLLHEFKKRWRLSKRGAIAEEHFFTTFIRNKLGGLFCHLAAMPHKKQALLACLPSEKHEFSLLLFAIDLMNHGYEVTLLGANTPLDETIYVANTVEPDAIVLSGKLTATHVAKLAKEKEHHFFCLGKNAVNKKNIILLADDFHLARETIISHKEV